MSSKRRVTAHVEGSGTCLRRPAFSHAVVSTSTSRCDCLEWRSRPLPPSVPMATRLSLFSRLPLKKLPWSVHAASAPSCLLSINFSLAEAFHPYQASRSWQTIRRHSALMLISVGSFPSFARTISAAADHFHLSPLFALSRPAA